MLHRFLISLDAKDKSLTIKEFTVITKIPKDSDFTALKEEDFLLTHEGAYNADTIKKSISVGQDALIAEIRTTNFFPTTPCSMMIAEAVTGLYDNTDSQSVEIYYDDKTMLAENAVSP
ncbi:MAG: hypothetical protein QNI92_05850 [Desulfobacterales bacterium]|nr:hypothetical protein [Desulfobacterales bacterium]